MPLLNKGRYVIVTVFYTVVTNLLTMYLRMRLIDSLLLHKRDVSGISFQNIKKTSESFEKGT